MTAFLVRIWRLLRGPLQWYILWFAHDKFIIGVSGIVLNEYNHVLLLKHRYWKEGSWGLPSGYANRGETLEEALCREVNEETGYTIEIFSLLKIVSGYKLRLEAFYLGRLIGGNLKLDQREVFEASFFAPNGLPNSLMESHREVISMALSQDILSPEKARGH